MKETETNTWQRLTHIKHTTWRQGLQNTGEVRKERRRRGRNSETNRGKTGSKEERIFKNTRTRIHNWSHWTVERTRHLKQNHVKKKHNLTLSVKHLFMQHHRQGFIFNRKEKCEAFYKLKQPSFILYLSDLFIIYGWKQLLVSITTYN